MAYQDTREFLQALKRAGELVRVKRQVALELEVGAVCRKVLDDRGPALWFEHPGEYRTPLITNTLATRKRIALALETAPDRLNQEWIERTSSPIPATSASADHAPCKQEMFLDEDVDVSAIPTPLWNELDGGRVITLACCFSVDPDSGQRNVGIYRAQIHSRNMVGLNAGPYRHVIQHAKSTLESGKPFPVALVIGVDPVIALAAAAGLPAGGDELGLAASLRRAPVEMVPCETIPVEVPAHAEIVLEGEILPGRTEEEGPFGDVTGYYGVRAQRPVVRIKAITQRKDPIHVAAYTGTPPSENATMVAIQNEAELVRTVPLPGIRQVHVTEGGCGGINCIVSIAKAFEGHAKMMGLAILGVWAGRTVKNVIIVDEDIDPFDWDQVEWAVATRFQPARDLQIIRGIIGHGVDPSLEDIDKKRGTVLSSKMILDATRYDAAHYERECRPDAATMRSVEEAWESYGIP